MWRWKSATERYWDARILRSSKRKLLKAYPRYDEPWKVAEDRRLLAVGKLAPKKRDLKYDQPKYEYWNAQAEIFGRSPDALRTRFSALLAGERLAKAEARRRARRRKRKSVSPSK